MTNFQRVKNSGMIIEK